MVFTTSKESDTRKEQRFVKSLLLVAMTSLTIGAPFLGYILYRRLEMPLLQALGVSLVVLIAGILLILFWNRKSPEI